MSESATESELFDEIAALFAARGQEAYGEGVSIAEHSLQTAALAHAESAEPGLVVAALLHDIGHFIEAPDDAFGYHKHDRSGGVWLAARFPAEVSEPVRLHVAAKRYLCAVEPEYFDRLSMASRYSLSKQGGPMTSEEAAEFARRAFSDSAVRLRRWDDGGKIAGMVVPPLESYRQMIAKACTETSR
jgi:[1-hydroxy-2-(trimethylamino)ethyl]phosphonate dioxygenase